MCIYFCAFMREGAFIPRLYICVKIVGGMKKAGRGPGSGDCDTIMDKKMLHSHVLRTIRSYSLFQPGEKVLAAVSGGADSLCLLYVLSFLAPQLKISLTVICINHCLRKESEDEVDFVCKTAGDLGLPFITGNVDVSAYRRKHGLSLQDAARRLRYALFNKWADESGASKVATGHHRDDQTETVLLNFLRGAGIDGLSGMRHKRFLVPGGVVLVRPLLDLSREDIEGYCREQGLNPIVDESNLKKSYRRNKIRLELIPYLESEYNPKLKEHITVLSRILARELDYLEAEALKRYSLLVREEKEKEMRVVLDGRAFREEPFVLQLRILRVALRYLYRGAMPAVGEKHLQAVVNLNAGKRADASIDLPGVTVKKSYDRLLLLRCLEGGGAEVGGDENKKLSPVKLQVPGETFLAGTDFSVESVETLLTSPGELSWPPEKSREAYLDYHKIYASGCGAPVVCSRWPGARFRPLGMKGCKKIKDYFIDQKVPLDDRERWPLLVAGGRIAWVFGMAISEDFRVTADTKEVLVLRLRDRKK